MVWQGEDIGDLDADGRLLRVLSFFAFLIRGIDGRRIDRCSDGPTRTRSSRRKRSSGSSRRSSPITTTASVRLAGLVCYSPTTTEDAVQARWSGVYDALDAPGRDADQALAQTQIVVREAIQLNAQPWWSRFGRRSEVREIVPLAIDLGVDRSRMASPNCRAEANLPRRTGSCWSTRSRGLPIEQRAVVALHLYAGYPVDETARLMGAGLETTRSRLRLAREAAPPRAPGDGPMNARATR